MSRWHCGSGADYVVSDATLNRFFALHVAAVPLVLLGLVGAHILALHEVGSNNPDGVEIKKSKDKDGIPLDGIPFHPYYTVKDIMGTVVCLILFALVVFFLPEFGGWFLESANFVPANPLKTPEHIVPVWYFTPYYAILRAIPDKLTGIAIFGVSTLIFFLVPWLDTHPVKSIRYRSLLFKLVLSIFALNFVMLGYLGTQSPTLATAELGLRLSELYFSFFLILWVYSKDRPAKFHWGLMIGLVVLFLILDAIRFDPEKWQLMVFSILLPIGYHALFLLGPLYTNWNESKSVPERVT